MLRRFQHRSELQAIEAQYAGRLWVFAPVSHKRHWALGIFVANDPRPNIVDPRLCSADRRDELLAYADELNRERGLLAIHTLLITRGDRLTDERVRDWQDYVDEYVRSRQRGDNA